MMRYLLVLPLVSAACISGVPEDGPPHYDSVRERMTAMPTWLFLDGRTSSGAVTARREHDERSTTTTRLALDHGYARAVLGDRGELAIDQLEIAVAPFAMDRMFDRPTQLRNVLLRLTEPVRADVTWTSDDAATARMPMVFDVGWSIAFDGGEPIPMVTQRLPRETVQIALSGDGDAIEASLDLDATGELWSCDAVQITEVALSLTAATAN